MTTHSSMPFPSSSTIPSYVKPIVISDDEDTVPRLPTLSPSPAPQPSLKASPWLRSPIRLSSISRHFLDNDTPSAMYEPSYMSAKQKRIIQRRASRLDQLSRAALFQQRLDRENAICDAAQGIRNRQLHAKELQMAIYHREQALLRKPVRRPAYPQSPTPGPSSSKPKTVRRPQTKGYHPANPIIVDDIQGAVPSIPFIDAGVFNATIAQPPKHLQPIMDSEKNLIYSNLDTISDTVKWWKELEDNAKTQLGIPTYLSGTQHQRRQALEVIMPPREYLGLRKTMD